MEDAPLLDARQSTDEFVNLIFGLEAYLQNQTLVPNSLRRALNAIAFALRDDFPRTLYNFVALCHRPIESWYPLAIPDDFNPTQPILYDRHLSEEAQEFCLTLSEQMELTQLLQADIPQTVLDNWKIIDLRHRLRERSDLQEAQALYVQIRSFLIEHSWATRDQFFVQSRAVFQELREFYEEIPAHFPSTLVVCDRCGLLEWRDQRWQGIRPNFCSDHGSGSPHISSLQRMPDLHRLRRGIHLRTFLPGRLELALFTSAEVLQAKYPDYLLSIERYPGLDTYDLRLSFADGEVWAVDAKDHAQPERLASQIRPFFNEGDLAHTHAFYVIPDARMEDANYRDQLEQRASGALSSALHIASVSVFQQRVEEKLKRLANPPRHKSQKRT